MTTASDKCGPARPTPALAPQEAATLARIHTACFPPPRAPRAWNAAEIATLAADPGCFLALVHQGDAIAGFVIGRCVLDEAELLTLAVDPRARRHGLGRALCADFWALAGARGAQTAFLEVAADNAPAQALYAAAGWQEAGRRKGYYGPDRDALILRRNIMKG